MEHRREPESGHISIWFIVLLLAAAILIGWAIGQAPTPPAPANPTGDTKTTTTTHETNFLGGATEVRVTRVGQGQAISQWTTYDAAMDESRRTGKPIMLDFNAEWCGPCQALKREVFDDYSRGEIVRSAVIPVSVVDRSREEGHNPPQVDELQARYQIDAFPTLVVFSPATGRVQKSRGYRGGDPSLGWIQEAAKSVQ
ncbi:MAG: thioredoxin family protein [Candidatus Eiseniibacteriota bacterium]